MQTGLSFCQVSSPQMICGKRTANPWGFKILLGRPHARSSARLFHDGSLSTSRWNISSMGIVVSQV